MIQDIEPKQYDITYEASKPEGSSIAIPFAGEKILMKKAASEAEGPSFITFEELGAMEGLQASVEEMIEASRFAFRIDEDKFYLVALGEEGLEDFVAANGLIWLSQPDFRTLPELWKCFAGATAIQIIRWYGSRKF